MLLFSRYPQSRVASFLFGDTRMSFVWLLLRLYLGYEWLMAGWEKVVNPAWVGSGAGTVVHNYLLGSLAKAAGEHPSVQAWYVPFINHVALPHSVFFSYLVAYGEVAVGLGLILGLFTAIAAFFGAFMNFHFLFSGTVSTNPEMIIMGFFLMWAWRTAGWYGLDRFWFPLWKCRVRHQVN